MSSVGLFSSEDFVDTVVLVGRVDGTDGSLQRIDDVENVIQFSYLRAVVGRAGEFTLARRVERGEPCPNGTVGASSRGLADGSEGVVDVRGREVGTGGRGEGRGGIDQRLNAAGELGIAVQLDEKVGTVG